MATTSSSHWLSWRPRSRRSHPLYTCMAVWLLLTCVVSAAAYDPHYYGSMTPTNPMVVTGSTLELNCTMSDVLEEENASSIYFIIGNRRINDTFVKVVNNRTVTLQYPNAQHKDNGHWFCRLPSVPLNPDDDLYKAVGQQYVTVADLPVKPNITGCVVYNWENMTCSWEPKVQHTGLVTNQTLYWTLQPLLDQYTCPHPTTNTCHWKEFDGTDYYREGSDYYLEVVAMNRLGSQATGLVLFRTESLVKPNRVINLRVSEKGHNYINLTWNPPAKDKDIVYNVRYTSLRTESWDEMNVTSRKTPDLKDFLNSEWVYLPGLFPFTTYTISVTCLPKSGEGFWSPEANITHTTKMSVPGAAPVIPPGGFSISSDHDNPDKRKVDILWQSIPEPSRNGKIVKFRLKYGPEVSEMVEFDVPDTMRHNLVLDRARTYMVTLEAATPVGYNTSLTLSPLLIPKEDKLPPKPSKLVSVAWQDDVVFVNWTAVEGARGYTVYWCKGRSQFAKCDKEMQWTPIDVNSTSHNVTLDSGDDSKQFIFGVSAELLWNGSVNRSRREAGGPLVVSSGVLWSDCTYDIDKPVSAPKSVDFSDHQKALSISLRWDPQDCGETIYIDKYIIFYCKVEDCPAEDGEEEGDRIGRLEVDSSRDDVTIEDLEPMDYRVWMRSYSSYKEGLSPPTKRKTVPVNQSGPTNAVIAVLSIFGLLVLFFIVFGLYQAYKMCQKKVKENVNVRIERPPEVANHIDRVFDDDRDDYMVHYTNLVDQDQQLSEQNSLIRENQANQQKERPHPNGDINARPCSPSSAPSFPGVQQPGALTAAPPAGVSSGYMTLDALEQLEPNQLLARVYLGDGSVGGRKLNGTASDNLTHNDMVCLHSPLNGHDGLVEDMNGGMRALPATPQDVSMKVGAEEQPPVIGGQQRSANGGKGALPYSQKANSGQQSAGSAIPSYSKCGLPDDGEAANRAEEPIYQKIDGEEEPSEPPASLPPPTYSAPPPAPTATTAASCQPAGRKEEGIPPATGTMDQAPSGNSNSSTQAAAVQPYTVLPVGEKTSSLPDPGYSARTEGPTSKDSLPTGGVAPGGGAMGQGSSSVSPYCQMVPQSDCSSLPQGGTEGANTIDQRVDSSPQVATSPLADGRNTSDYQQQIPTDPSVHNSYSPIPPEGGSTASMGTAQNGQLTTAQIPSGHVSPFSDVKPSLNIKNSSNGYVTVNM